MKAGFFLICTALPMVMAAPAMAQDEIQADETQAANEPRPPRRANNWSLNLSATWTDNYLRLGESLIRTDVDAETGTVSTVPAEIDPPENTILSVALAGTSYVFRDRLSGFLTGSLRVGGYLEDTDVESDLLSSADPASPFPGEPDATGSYSAFGLDELDRTFIEPDLVGAGTIELQDNLAYLDVAVQARQESYAGNSAVSRRSEGIDPGSSTTLGASISPYYFHQWEDDQQVELRLRGSAVTVIQEQPATRVGLPGEDFDDDDQFTNDSYAGELSALYDTGNKFGDIAFGATGRARKVKEEGSDVLPEQELDTLSAGLAATYAVNTALKVTGTAGYDDVSLDIGGADETADSGEDDFSGVYWSLGFNYMPSRRLTLSLSGGERYGGPSLSGNLQFRITPRLTFSMNADRVLDTGGQRVISALGDADSNGLSLIEQLSVRQEGVSADFIDRALDASGIGLLRNSSIQPGVYAYDRYGASLLGDFRRTQVALGVQYEDAEDGNDANTQSFEAYLSAQRRLSRRLTFGTSYTFSHTEGVSVAAALDGRVDEGAIAESHIVDADLTYALGRRLSAVISAYHIVENTEDSVALYTTGADPETTAIIFSLRWLF